MTHPTPQSRPHNQYSSYYREGQQTHYREGRQTHQIQFGDFAPRRQPSRAPQAQYQTHHRAAPYPPSAQVPTAAVYPPPPVQTMRRQPRVKRRSARRSPRSYLLAGGSMLALAALVVGPKPIVDRNASEATAKVVCQETVQAKSVLSRAELSELLSVSERAPKADVEAIIEEPYCTLPPVQVREGVTAQRVAYPLEFNPETWFIVLYEGEEYAGFDFSFSRN